MYKNIQLKGKDWLKFKVQTMGKIWQYAIRKAQIKIDEVWIIQ